MQLTLAAFMSRSWRSKLEAREAVVLGEGQAREHALGASYASAAAAQVWSTACGVEGSVVQHAHNAIMAPEAAADDACTASQLVTQVQDQCEHPSQQVEALGGGESDSDMPLLVSSAEGSDDTQRLIHSRFPLVRP